MRQPRFKKQTTMTETYTYDTNKKNAVVQVENTGNLIQGAASLTYNAFNKVATVVQGTNTLTITYGPDRQRTKTVLVNGSNTTTTLYADNYEQRTANGVTTTYHYVASPDGLAAVYVKSGSTATAYYIETDHLGSIVRAYDYIGNVKFSAAYDAWGNQTVSTNAIGLTRGYTGHEHWNQFGLIDMNGRFYDPLLGRFLSPDPYVQAPDNPQNYNRYSYCLNNPLKYTDPNGYWFGYDDLVAGIVGFVAGYVSYGLATGNWTGKAFAAGGFGAFTAWVGWNTLGAGDIALTEGAGSATTFAEGASAVLGPSSSYYGGQFAALSILNTTSHSSQMKAADKAGWNGVWSYGAYAVSSALMTDPELLSAGKFAKNTGNYVRLRQIAGINITDNISDNMNNGIFEFHSYHIGPVGWDADRHDNTWGGLYTVFSKGLSDGQRLDMGIETVFMLSMVKDIHLHNVKVPHTGKDICGQRWFRMRSLGPRVIKTGYIGKYADSLICLSDIYFEVKYQKTVLDYWYSYHYNEDRTAKY